MKNIPGNFIIILLVFIVSCSGSNINEDFKGDWVKILPANSLAGSYISLFFSDSEFRIKIHHYTDVYADTCLSDDASWKEYLNGSFVLKEGKIVLIGFWTDSAFSREKESGCFNTGKFNETYQYQFKGKDTLVMKMKDSKLEIAVPENDFNVTFVRK